MQQLLTNIKININDKIFIKDPETSDLGKKIIGESIVLIHDMGFENFNFKKLGEKIGSNESSIYRYFENKHKLLVYLTSWYWGWVEYKLAFGTNNIANTTDKLKRAITIITLENKDDDITTQHVNEAILHKIVIAEFSKTLLTKQVDEENKDGYFIVFKRVIYRLSEIISDINPDYAFAQSLASTIVLGSINQQFMSDHLKTITNCKSPELLTEFYIDLAINTLKK